LAQVSVKVQHTEAARKKQLAPKQRICSAFLVKSRKPNPPGTLRIDDIGQQPNAQDIALRVKIFYITEKNNNKKKLNVNNQKSSKGAYPQDIS
jgi:hypothetical protein